MQPAGHTQFYTTLTDATQNFAARIGIGTQNDASGSQYGFNPITRNRTQLEWMYRGSWVCGRVVDCVADDMVRAGIDIATELAPDVMERINGRMTTMGVWSALGESIKWGRLYGGSIAAIMIDGADMSKPLVFDRVGPGTFRGLLPLDRWTVTSSQGELVEEMGPDIGRPAYYDVTGYAPALRGQRIHHSRAIRIEGDALPIQQRMYENGWGMSVLERMFDRLVAFDSTTQGAAQLVYKAHLRTIKVKNLRRIIAEGGNQGAAVLQQLDLIRLLQTIEGLTLLDAEDDFETHSYAFSGLSDVMLQFGQQLSGACGIPLVRLFGQSPAGLNATGDADIRLYYDEINAQQERSLRRGIAAVIEIAARSETGGSMPAGWGFKFNPLWQMNDDEKVTIADKVSTAVERLETAGIISRATALRELRQSADVTGVFSNITDEEIEEAENEPPPAPEAALPDRNDPGDEADANRRPGDEEAAG